MAEGLPRRVFADWRGLGLFWLLVLLVLGGVALRLDRLGPPEPHETVAEAPQAPEALAPPPAAAEPVAPPAAALDHTSAPSPAQAVVPAPAVLEPS